MSRKSLKVMAWNLKDGLSDETRAMSIARTIAEHEPDIAIFSEGTEEHHEIDHDARKILEHNVGTIYEKDYGDYNGRKDRHKLVAVAKPELGEPETVRALHRVAFKFSHDGIETIGYHAFDRLLGSDPHEARLRQARYLNETHMTNSPDVTNVFIGDPNDLHAEDTVAKLLRAAGPLVAKLSAGEPGTSGQTKLERFASLAQRSASYAEGLATTYLEEQGYRDADPMHRATMSAKVGGVTLFGMQLDRAMIRNGYADRPVIINSDDSDHDGTVSNVYKSEG